MSSFPGPFTFIYSKSSPRFLTVLNFKCVFRVDPRNIIGFPACSHKRFKQVPVVSAYGIYTGTNEFRVQELCESRDGRPGLPSLINLLFCGRKATLQPTNMEWKLVFNVPKHLLL